MMLTKWKKYALSFSIAYLCTATLWEAKATDRCQSLAHQVKTSHYQYFGTDFPYHYGIGQLQQESNCRNVISNDGVGSEGPGQITYKVWKDPLRKQGILEVRTTKNNLRAQAYINKVSYAQARHKRLWIMFQIFNGGGLVNKEIDRAGGLNDWNAARAVCKRKIVHFSNGASEDACTINYQYSNQVFKYGQLYRTTLDSTKFPYW